MRPRSIEKVFTDCVKDLKRIVALDGIDIFPDEFRVRSHDLHGQLPEIMMMNSGDSFRDKDRLGNEVCKLIAIVRIRDELIRFLPRATFLPPMRLDGKPIVGLQAKPRTWIAEGKDFIAAYHELHRKVVGD